MPYSETYLKSRTPRELAQMAALPLGHGDIDTAHKGFNAEANHPTRGYVGTGNVISGVQRSTFVRAASRTRCNGFRFREGELRESDMKLFKRMPWNMRRRIDELSADRDLIVYEFSSPVQGGAPKVHGWLITDSFYRHLETACLPGQKAMSVLHDMQRRLSWSDATLRDPDEVSPLVEATRSVDLSELRSLAELLGYEIAADPAECREHHVYHADEHPVSAFRSEDPQGTLVRAEFPEQTAAMMCIRAAVAPERVCEHLDRIRSEQALTGEAGLPEINL